MSYSRVAIIGAGRVGSTTAYALLLRNVAAEIMLVDINQELCAGEVDDLSDALPFSETSSVRAVSMDQAAGADIIIIAAGKAQGPDQSRRELVDANAQIVRSMADQLKPINPNAIIIVVTNPVDLMTQLVQESGILPRNQIFGSGTMLDTQRLRGYISKEVNVAEQSVHVYILGEHGDSQFVAWSSADIGGVPLNTFAGLTQSKLDALAAQARQKVYEIIKCKGSTYYGVATCVAAYCESILFNQKRVMPVSWYQKEFDVCLSMPAVIGRSGIEQLVDIPLDASEREQLSQSVQVVRQMYESIA